MHRILIVEKISCVGGALKNLLTTHYQDIEVKETAYSTILSELALQTYDVLILGDHQIEESLLLVSACHKEFPNLHILVISDENEIIIGPIFIKYGSKGFINRSASIETVLHAVDLVMKGRLYFSEQLVHGYSSNSFLNASDGLLTNRELEILHALARMATQMEIAKIFNISVSRVKTHKKSIFKKLKINNIYDILKYSKLLVDDNP